jgi:hypothetical protein
MMRDKAKARRLGHFSVLYCNIYMRCYCSPPPPPPPYFFFSKTEKKKKLVCKKFSTNRFLEVTRIVNDACVFHVPFLKLKEHELT